MSASPGLAKMEECVRTWRLDIPAHVVRVSLERAVKRILMSATPPPARMEEHVWMLSMTSGKLRNRDVNHKTV